MIEDDKIRQCNSLLKEQKSLDGEVYQGKMELLTATAAKVLLNQKFNELRCPEGFEKQECRALNAAVKQLEQIDTRRLVDETTVVNRPDQFTEDIKHLRDGKCGK